MCGIAGMVARKPVDPALLRLMTAQIAHRGPDGEGVWTDPDARVGFGHRRLAIVDLSSAGHQPMASRDGRWVLNFNGEIYNHVALRTELEADGTRSAAGDGWRGHSDTETLVEGVAAWGLERTVRKCVGMFAFALWDNKERRLHLVRDRMGEKPLYYGWVGGDFVFASELKALRVLPEFDNGIDRRALGLFMRYGCVPAPFSIFERIFKLEPGCILSAEAESLRAPLDEAPEPGSAMVQRYWSYRDIAVAGLESPLSDECEAADRLEQVLLESVRGQSLADVPVGAFLSGGLDSSTVVALHRQHAPVRTFTIGFEDAAFDESAYAETVADRLGTEHHRICVTARDAQAVIPLLPQIYDEPFADSSQIPTYLVSKYARSMVKVVLSGDGGDELFGGYNRYLTAPRLWALLSGLPGPVRAGIGSTLGHVPPAVWNKGADLLGRRSRQPHFGTKVRKTFRTMGRARTIDDVYESFVDEWHGERHPAEGAPVEVAPTSTALGAAPDAVRMMYRDAVSYLPDDILTKVDRAAMAVSLETRLPFLDHRVIELAARIPLHMKISGGAGKQVLRKILFRHVPESLFDRPKTGFAIPVGEWIRGPLREWAEELLYEDRLRAEGLFDPGPIRRRWRDHLEGRGDSTAALWSVLMFQAWKARN